MRGIIVTLAAMLAMSSLAAAESAGPSEADIERRATDLAGKLTLEEKIDLLGGVDGFDVRGAPRIGGMIALVIAMKPELFAGLVQ